MENALLSHGGTRFSYSHDIPENKRIHIYLARLKPFCFVRHPLSFVYSIWRHWSGNPVCRMNNSNPKKRVMWDKKYTADFYCAAICEESFPQTVLNFSEQWPGFVTWLYTRFTTGCFYVGRFENLRTDLFHAIRLINGSVTDELKTAIFQSQPQNQSAGPHSTVSRDLAERFMKNEPCAQQYGYDYMPDFIDRDVSMSDVHIMR